MTIEFIEEKLMEIWNECNLNPEVKERGFVFADPQKTDLLITGINPSWRNGPCEQKVNCHGIATENLKPEIWKQRNGKRWDTYWGPIRKMLVDEEKGINLIGRVDYLDIFHFKEQNQKFLTKDILKLQSDGIDFIRRELNLTQHIIEENIQPKLILVKNKESWAYWGKRPGFVWMGYQFEQLQKFPCGELCQIVGLQDSNERIAPEITQTKLIGTHVLFSNHINQFTKREQRPTAELLYSILSGNY